MSIAAVEPFVGIRPAPARRAQGDAGPKESFDRKGDPTRLLRYAAGIPIVGGLAETVYGILEVKHAKNHEARNNGLVDIGLGISGTINNAASIPLYARLVTSVSNHVLQIAGPIAGIAGAFSAALDGGRDIINGCHHHDTSEKMVGVVKIASGAITATGAFMASLPLMGIATVAYVGAVAYQNRDSLKSAWHQVEDWWKHHHHA